MILFRFSHRMRHSCRYFTTTSYLHSQSSHKTLRYLLEEGPLDTPLRAQGWVRSVRIQKNVSFIVINDGSNLKGLQCVLNSETGESLTTGTAVEIEGVLVRSHGKEQNKELQVEKMKVIGSCPAETYPMQKKNHSVEYLRENAHFRARQNTTAAMLRIRNQALQGVERFLQENEFIHVHTPIITSHDCEGGGDVFAITTPVTSPDITAMPSSGLSSPSQFFGKPVYLTVSGQLHAEILASSLSRVYTFGPVFRAEKSLTSRHLSEFWMLEAEIAFLSGLGELTNITEGLIQGVIKHVLESSVEDLEFFSKYIDKGALTRLHSLVNKPFMRMTYTEAINALQEAVTNRSVNFEIHPEWGRPLQSEHEKYLVATVSQGPVFVTDYPQTIKPFYMRLNESSSSSMPTVGCFDLLMPGAGELVGGSLREERYDLLEENMLKNELDLESYKWYLDLRKYGSVPHGGFGVGFERLIAMMTGIENVKDCIAFPRWVGRCKY